MSFLDKGEKENPNDDIRNLFNKIGEDSSSYKEIKQENRLVNTRQAWPLVNAIEHVRDEAPKRRFSNGETTVSPAVVSVLENPLSVEETQPAIRSTGIKSTDSNSSHSLLFAPRGGVVEESSLASKRSSISRNMLVSEQTASSARLDVRHQTAEIPSLQGNRLAKLKEPYQRSTAGHLFPSMQSASMPAASPLSDDSLAAVFSRLTATPDTKAEHQPAGGLRNMLNFLKKE